MSAVPHARLLTHNSKLDELPSLTKRVDDFTGVTGDLHFVLA